MAGLFLGIKFQHKAFLQCKPTCMRWLIYGSIPLACNNFPLAGTVCGGSVRCRIAFKKRSVTEDLCEMVGYKNLTQKRLIQLKRQGIKKEDKSLFGELLRKSYDDDFEPSRLPKMATAYPPGSVGKLVTMAMRLVAGEELYHPNDEKIAATVEEHNEAITFCQIHAAQERKSKA